MKFNIDNERKHWLLVCLGIVGFGVVALFLLTALKSEPTLTPIVAKTPIVDAERLVWQSGRFEITASGRVVPVATVNLQAQVSGQVIELSESLKSGAHFKSGAALLKIDPLTLRAKAAELEAQLASAKADLKLAKSQITRSKKLLELKAVSREELDQRQAEFAAANARVAQFEASLLSAKTDLSRSIIRAPFDGRVMSERVSVGDVLAPGVAFAEIYSTEAFELSLALPEADAVLLENLFSIDTAEIVARVEASFGGSRFFWPAVVDRVEAGLDSATRTINVVVRIDAPEARGQAMRETEVEAPPLLSSMFAQAFIQTRDVGRYVKVGRDSVRSDDTIWFVQVNAKGIGTVQSANVKTLNNQQETAYVRPDLEDASDTYVLGSDIGGVLPGNQVQIRNHQTEQIEPQAVAPIVQVDQLAPASVDVLPSAEILPQATLATPEVILGGEHDGSPTLDADQTEVVNPAGEAKIEEPVQ